MSRARDLSKLSNPSVFTVDTDNNLGVNSTSPVEKLNVVGVVSATSFFGDGSALSGIALDATSLKDDGGNIKAQANPNGIVVTGVTTSTTFSGNLTGDVVGNVTGNISGATGAFTGDVSIGGTLTYEDVTNVDSVGVITARSGVNVSGGSVLVGSATTITSGGVNVTGVITATSFVGDGSGLDGLSGWTQEDTWLYGG
tara:strand:+ start:125 stop:718 length:594 start_codon:yes stop_codon:yes gene_type:complete